MVKIDKIIPGGQALGTHDDGRKIFFWNALPGEHILEYDITKQKSNYYEAIATKIGNSSPHRRNPHDSCYLSTSPWQIMDYAYELQTKQALVVEIFREHSINIDTPEISTDYNEFYYRNKMEYALYWDNETGRIHPAFHQRGSHRKIPIKTSSLERSEIFTSACQIIDELNFNHEDTRKYQSLLLRCNQAGQVSGGLYENHRPHPKFQPLTDSILGQTFSYSPNGFFQINLPVYEMALSEIQKHITTDKVLDLYAGVGTIGLTTAQGRKLTLIEVDKSAYLELCKNITSYDGSQFVADNKAIHNLFYSSNGDISAILGKSEEILEYITPDTTVIVDPPRAGCDIKLINKLISVTPDTLIYLSCNPATQARDVRLLSEKYSIKTIKTFNFFPHTPHIENLVILEKTC